LAISIGFSVFCRLLPTSLFGSFVSSEPVILIARNKLRRKKEGKVLKQTDPMDWTFLNTVVPATNNLSDPRTLSLSGQTRPV
jgi:hypothetical protein